MRLVLCFVFDHPDVDCETPTRGNPVGTENITKKHRKIVNSVTVKAAVVKELNVCSCIKKHMKIVDKDVKQKLDACNFDRDKDEVNIARSRKAALRNLISFCHNLSCEFCHNLSF